jgi:hypothetical protein
LTGARGTCVLLAGWWLVSAVVLLAGCGSDDEPRPVSDREQIEAAATGYLEGFADGDGEEACRHLSERAQRDVGTIAEAGTCIEAIEKFHQALDDEQREALRDVRIARIRIDGARAKVAMAGGDTVPFEKGAGGWKVMEFASGGGYRTRAEGECIIGGMDEFDDGGGDPNWHREGRADFRDFIVEFCRRADRRGVLREDGPLDRRALERIARRVMAEMGERGQIRYPR